MQSSYTIGWHQLILEIRQLPASFLWLQWPIMRPINIVVNQNTTQQFPRIPDIPLRLYKHKQLLYNRLTTFAGYSLGLLFIMGHRVKSCNIFFYAWTKYSQWVISLLLSLSVKWFVWYKQCRTIRFFWLHLGPLPLCFAILSLPHKTRRFGNNELTAWEKKIYAVCEFFSLKPWINQKTEVYQTTLLRASLVWLAKTKCGHSDKSIHILVFRQIKYQGDQTIHLRRRWRRYSRLIPVLV